MGHLHAQAVAHSKTYQLNYPIRHGLIENWNNMERLWQRCFYDYLRVEPEDHYVLLVRVGCGFAIIFPTARRIVQEHCCDAMPHPHVTFRHLYSCIFADRATA
jgi:hypothetical protein